MEEEADNQAVRWLQQGRRGQGGALRAEREISRMKGGDEEGRESERV